MRTQLAVAGLALAACSWLPSRGSCDRHKLDALAAEIGPAPPAEAGVSAALGVRDACGAALPPPLAARLAADADLSTSADEPSPVLVGLLDRVCSERQAIEAATASAEAWERPARLYEACELDRFGVLADGEAERYQRASLLDWALHQWLLDDGIDAAVARPITRALLIRSDRGLSPLQLLAGQELPVTADGRPIGDDDVFVHASTTGLTIDGAEVGDVAPGTGMGFMLDRVVSALAGDHAGKTVVLAADRRVSSSALLNVVYSARAAGLERYGLAVAAEGWSFRVLDLVPPRVTYEPDGPHDVIHLSIVANEEGLSVVVLDDSGEPEAPVTRRAGDYAGLRKEARAVKELHPSARHASVSAAPEVTIEVVANTIDAVRETLPDVWVHPAGEHLVGPQAFQVERARERDGQGVARVLGTYGGPGEGSVFDVIEDTKGGKGTWRHELDTPPASGGAKPKGRFRFNQVEVGGLDGPAVMKTLRRRSADPRQCYDEALRSNPKLSGTATVVLGLHKDGRVSRLVVKDEDLGSPEIVACLRKRLQQWSFPVEQGTKAGTVRATFIFETASR